MNESLFTAAPWFTLVTAFLLYLVDIYLTIRERWLYFSGAQDVIAITRFYTLSKPFDPARGWRQLFNRRYVLLLAGLLVGVPLAWWVLVQVYHQPGVFLFAAGGLILLELTEVIRMLRMNALYGAALKNEGFKGQIEVPHYLFSNLYAVDMYGYAVIYLLAFLFTNSLFFMGGAVLSVTRAHSSRDFSIYTKLKNRRGIS